MAGHSFEVFMYNDPDETDWNVIVESMDIAQTLCWLGPDGWHQAVKLDDIPEPGTELHNIEFLIPVDSVSGEATISVNMGQ
jgi:hypothetical protein